MEASNTTPQAEPVDVVDESVESPVPRDNESMSTDDLLREILLEQRQHRAEVAELRAQVEAERNRPAPAPSQPQTPEELLAARMNAISEKDYYCPGCGALYDYRQRCTGRFESPHPPIEVVSTDELKAGDESKHTAPVYVQQ